MQYATITTVKCEAWEGLEDEIQSDQKLKKIVQDLTMDPNSHTRFHLKQGRLYHEDIIVIPKDSPRVSWILHEMHDTSMEGILAIGKECDEFFRSMCSLVKRAKEINIKLLVGRFVATITNSYSDLE
ncbi:hypothetical protein L195_g002554 [Trifolium pratense]|uniref:Uncharacterized protein n=1 Tax=Trifolium pratense TaxID=57577 RepID=A0A2K3NSS9_TRIPR|nr:hypothetical protein L195_g002554 [Trifolium pratense]